MAASIELLEREEELATIERVLCSAGESAGGLLAIEGEAGAGKTALLDAAARRGEEVGMQVLRARGGEFERDFPYGVVRQLFEPLLDASTRRQELLGGNGAAAIPVFEPAAAPGEGADPFAVQHGLHCLVLALAESAPVLMLVDDAQWADLASLRALAYIGRRLASLSAALALTVRRGELGEHERLLDELRREPGALTIEPPPLSVAAVAVLATAESGRVLGEGFATACRDATAGNPFLLVELLRALDPDRIDGGGGDAERLAEAGAAGASRTILARLNHLGEQPLAVARAVAVLEPHAETHRIAGLSGLSIEAVADACERLVLARLLSDARPIGFVHPLVRAAVLGEVPRPRRAADHARAARLLSEDGAPTDALAAHLLLAEPSADAWAVGELRAAAAEATNRGAPEAAISYLRRALREPPPKGDRLAVSRELGVALLLADDPEGVEVLRAVRGALDDPVPRAEIATELSVSLAFRRPGGEGVALLEESLAEIPEDRTGLALLLRGHQLIQLLGGMERIPDGLHPEREEWPEGDTVEGRLVLHQLVLLYAIGFGQMKNVMELVERADTDPDVYASDVRAGLPGHYVAAGQALADRGELTEDLFVRTLDASKQHGTVASLSGAHGMRAYCRFLDGDLRGADADAELAIRLTEPIGLRVPLTNWVAVALRTLLARSGSGAAQALLDEVWRGRDPGPGAPGASLLVARGELRLESGRYAEARHDFIAASERVRWLPYANPEVLGWRTGLALAEDALGNGGGAQRLAREALRLAREAGGPRGIGIAQRVLGTVTPCEKGIELLREASETLAGTRARLQHAEALAGLGAALRRANRRRDAREPLREALDLAHRCDATALEERARTELAATGARPRKAVLTGVESLTPSELRVARMAAEGMTNREIAQSLFVTVKTVETHLRHAYQKLDVARRTELVTALDGDTVI